MVSSIRFSNRDVQYSISCDETFSLKTEANYRDAPEDETKQIIREIEAGQNWREVIARHFQSSYSWLFDVITYKNRDLFFRLFCQTQGALVLDIGSGWGQIALPLTKNNQVCVLEPTPERLDFIRSVARQDSLTQKMFFINADYMKISFETRFDVITCIGVLEWVGAFSDKLDAQSVQQDFLKKIHSELRKGGQCVIGIENRLGLKYLLGAVDDHLSVSDVAIFDSELAKQKWFELKKEPLLIFTYTREEYRALLRKAGFSKINFYAAFPDYKLPQVILSADEPQPVNQFFIEGNYIAEHNGTTGNLLPNQAELKSHYRSLSTMGVAHYFVPSYFIVAS